MKISVKLLYFLAAGTGPPVESKILAGRRYESPFSVEELLNLVIPVRMSQDMDMDPCKAPAFIGGLSQIYRIAISLKIGKNDCTINRKLNTQSFVLVQAILQTSELDWGVFQNKNVLQGISRIQRGTPPPLSKSQKENFGIQEIILTWEIPSVSPESAKGKGESRKREKRLSTFHF